MMITVEMYWPSLYVRLCNLVDPNPYFVNEEGRHEKVKWSVSSQLVYDGATVQFQMWIFQIKMLPLTAEVALQMDGLAQP